MCGRSERFFAVPAGLRIDGDSERFEEARVLGTDAQLRFAPARGLGTGFAGLALIEADSGLKDHKDVIAAGFDAGDDLGDVLGFRDRVIDGFAKLLHEPFEFLIHGVFSQMGDTKWAIKIRCGQWVKSYLADRRAKVTGSRSRRIRCWSRAQERYNNSVMSDVQSPGKFSLGGTLGAGAGTVFRWLRGKPGRNTRMFRGVRSGVSGFLKPVLAVLRVLFLEISGFIFLCFSVIIVSAFIREYRKYAMHQAGLERVILAGGVGVIFFYFGVSSFWWARQKRSRI